jgi:hypothetical protein
MPNLLQDEIFYAHASAYRSNDKGADNRKSLSAIALPILSKVNNGNNFDIVFTGAQHNPGFLSVNSKSLISHCRAGLRIGV